MSIRMLVLGDPEIERVDGIVLQAEHGIDATIVGDASEFRELVQAQDYDLISVDPYDPEFISNPTQSPAAAVMRDVTGGRVPVVVNSSYHPTEFVAAYGEDQLEQIELYIQKPDGLAKNPQVLLQLVSSSSHS